MNTDFEKRLGQRHIYADEIFHLVHVLKVSYDDICPQFHDSES